MRRPKKRRGWRIVLWLVVILAAVRAALPYALEFEIKRAFSGDGRYTVALDDVDLHLWRGAYDVQGLAVTRAGDPEPLLRAERLALTLSWRGLANGKALGEVKVVRPVLRMQAAQRDEKRPGGEDWKDRLARLYPFRIGEIDIRDGKVHYGQGPGGLSLSLEDVAARAENLTNVEGLAGGRPARLSGSARLRGGALRVNVTFDPFAKQPEFSLEARATDVTLADAGAFLRNRGNLDVEGGTLDVLIDMRAAGGRYQGTVRPIFENVRLVRWQEDRGNAAWEALRDKAEEEVRERLPATPGHFTSKVRVAGAFPEGQGNLEGVALALGEAIERTLAKGLAALLESGPLPDGGGS